MTHRELSGTTGPGPNPKKVVLVSFVTALRKHSILLALLLSACTQTPRASIIADALPPEEENSQPQVGGVPAPSVPESEPESEATDPSTPVTNPVWGPEPEPSPAHPLSPFPLPSPKPSHNALGPVLEFFTRHYAQAFGVYDRGWLKNPDKLPNTGNGILKLFQPRDRGYGTLDMVSLITAAGKKIHREMPATESLQIGDISDANGGQLGGHGSHQNGLDADIVFLRRNHRSMDPTTQKTTSTGFDEDFVDSRGVVTKNLDIEANWKLIQILVDTGRVDRIFVDHRIKNAFCAYAVANGRRAKWAETLRKLRHWPNHQDHMHLRITCPEKSLDCKPTSAIPEGDGCELLKDQGEPRTGGFSTVPALYIVPPESVLDEHGC